MSKYIIFNTIVEYFYLFQILERNNVCVTGRKKSEFSDEDLTQDVDRSPSGAASSSGGVLQQNKCEVRKWLGARVLGLAWQSGSVRRAALL